MRWTAAGLKLAHRLRRWHNIKPTLAQRLMFAGTLAEFHWSLSRKSRARRGSHGVHENLRGSMRSAADSFSGTCYSTALQSQKAVSTHFSGEKILLFGRARQQLWTKVSRAESDVKHYWYICTKISQQTQNICITFIQRPPNVFDVGRHCINVIHICCVY